MAHWFMNTIGTDIAIKKNIALKYAKQPWVLCLDADEELSPQLQDALIKFITSPPEVNGAYFPRKVWFWGDGLPMETGIPITV